MSIWVRMKVTDGMKRHIKGYTNMFIEEVIGKASFRLTDLKVLFHLVLTGNKLNWIQLTRDLNIGYNTLMTSLRKLITLGLVVRKKVKNRDAVYYYDEREEKM